MPVYPTNPNKPLSEMNTKFRYHLQLIIGDKLEQRTIIATSHYGNNLHYNFYEDAEIIAAYPINYTIIYSIEPI